MEDLNEREMVAKLFLDVVSLLKQSMVKVFEDIGITAPQGMVIGILMKHKRMKIGELSSLLSLSNSTVSGIVDRLEKQEMVERERSEEDKRVVYVRISSKFEASHQNFHRRSQENLQNIINKGTPEELNKIVEGLNALKKLLN